MSSKYIVPVPPAVGLFLVPKPIVMLLTLVRSTRLVTDFILRQSESQAESCPDDLKSTDLTLSSLYHNDSPDVKEDPWVTKMTVYCDFDLQAPQGP